MRARAKGGGAAGETAELKAWIDSELPRGQGVQLSTAGGGSGWARIYTGELSAPVRVEGSDRALQSLFCKVSSNQGAASMFKGEAEGLRALRAAGDEGLRVPLVIGSGEVANGAFIVMEKLNIGGGYSMAELGDGLGRMHTATPIHEEAKFGQFGFPVSNTIGATYQPNEWCDSWVEFFRERRLRHMLTLARDSHLSSLGERLLAPGVLEGFFKGVTVTPSILHGDLWSGNISGLRNERGNSRGGVTIFDPAVYYGHHEAEFGMSWCASFTSDFWTAYRRHVPKEAGFENRLRIYKLYHYLNHFVLFGSGYKQECVSILQYLLR